MQAAVETLKYALQTTNNSGELMGVEVLGRSFLMRHGGLAVFLK